MRDEQGRYTVAFADEDGVFVAAALPPGEYTIVPANGWGPERKAIVLRRKRNWLRPAADWLFGREHSSHAADVGVIEIVPPRLAEAPPDNFVALGALPPAYGAAAPPAPRGGGNTKRW